jgi:hypothetical protein
MPEHVVREELGAHGVCVQGNKQFHSGLHDRDPGKDSPVTPHYVVTVARSLVVTKIRSKAQICGPRVTVETYTAPKECLQCKSCQRLGDFELNFGYVPR